MISPDWKDDQWSRAKSIDPDTIAQIRKLRGQQLTYEAIALVVGVSAATCYKYSRDLPDPNRKITESRAAEIKHLRRKGYTYEQIGEALGISRQCAAKHSLGQDDHNHFLILQEMNRGGIFEMPSFSLPTGLSDVVFSEQPFSHRGGFLPLSVKQHLRDASSRSWCSSESL